MTASPTPSPTTNAVQVWKPDDVVALMDEYPEKAYNRLFPVDAISQVNPMLAPRVELIRLSPDENAGEIYHSNDMKAGMYAPTKVGLRRLADLASVTTVASRRIDDGSDPWYVIWQVEVELAVPGRRPRRGIGSKEIRLSGESIKGWSGERLVKAREHMIAMAESKALNRAIRDVLTLRSSYPKAELTKPFAVFRWEPNMANPQVAERFLDNLLPAVAAAYGPDVKQVGAGEGYEVAPHRPDDDDIADGQFVEVATNGHAKVEVATGEIVSESGPEPDWFGTTEPAAPSLIEQLRSMAAKNADDAPAGDKDRERMRSFLAPLGLPAVKAVLAKAFGLADLKDITQGQAGAVLELSARDDFTAEWAKAAAAE